ncbi:MAG: Mbov_0395 family pilin-like conjugal transfer protein [Patescibacteria group bacterium]
MKNKKSIFFLFALFVILLFCYFVILPNVLAQYGLEKAEGITGIAKGTIPEYVGGIINAVVGILGVILVVLIIYGGVMYMTSAGSEEKTKSARNILTYAIIGVVIVFASYIISKFVLSALTEISK